MDDTELRKAIDDKVKERTIAILESMRARVESDVRQELIKAIIGGNWSDAESVKVPEGELSKETVTAVAQQAVDAKQVTNQVADQVAAFTGVRQLNDTTWACYHCAREFDTRRGAAIHANSCPENKLPQKLKNKRRFSSRRQHEVQRKPCIVPGCDKPSKGPRFHFLCEDHRNADEQQIKTWQAKKEN